VRTAVELHASFNVVVADAGTCDDALAAAAEVEPELIVLDLGLGEGNGLDFLRQIKAKCDYAEVIVYSAFGGAHIGEAARRAGAAAYVPKGSLEPLLTAIDRLVESRREPGESDDDEGLAAVAAHGMMNTVTVVWGAAALLARGWERVEPAKRAELRQVIIDHVAVLREQLVLLPAVAAHTVLNHMADALFAVEELRARPDAPDNDLVEMLARIAAPAPQVTDVLAAVVQGIPAEVMLALDQLQMGAARGE